MGFDGFGLELGVRGLGLRIDIVAMVAAIVRERWERDFGEMGAKCFERNGEIEEEIEMVMRKMRANSILILRLMLI